MDSISAQNIKKQLEETFDIPFDVVKKYYDSDTGFIIRPHNQSQELFTINIRFKEQLRLIMEVKPENYAAFAIRDMSMASDEKRNIFSEYAAQLHQRKAKVDFYINDISCNVIEHSVWPKEWNSYKLRITKSPICDENELFDEVKITSSWVSIVAGMMLSLLNIDQIYLSERKEGGVNRIEVNRYERNPINRELCLSAKGYQCAICGFDFQKTYGDIGEKYIHVHHIVPVSKMSEQYMIDPIRDLIPVCPNCHAMLHRQDPPYHPEQLAEIISSKK